MNKPWIPCLDWRIYPPYRAVVTALQSALATGALAPGDHLPPQRFLADYLGLSVNTVNRGLREAARLGLTTARTGAGTVIRSDALAASAVPGSSASDATAHAPHRGVASCSH